MEKTKQKFTVDYNTLFNSVLNEKGTISKCFSLFHNYSIKNQFLACWQLQAKGLDIQPISSFSGWKKLNRHVKKGETAIYLWQPFTIKEKVTDEETGKTKYEDKLIFKFKPSWFGLEQTEGEELKDTEQFVADFDKFNLKKICDKNKIKLVKYTKVDGNCQGYANLKDRTLALNPLASDKDLTVIHEIAHILLEHDKVKFGTDLQELEAETVAYIVGSVIGATEQQLSESRGYVQGWFKGNIIPEYNANRIMRVANDILKVGLG